jgi:calcineurin-like phosphoesterase family protein
MGEAVYSDRALTLIWFSADWHIKHNGILKHMPLRATVFGDVDIMSAHFVAECNRVVKPNDELRIIGDWIWGTKWYGHYRAKLNVRKIHVIGGNHDSRSLHKHVSSYKEIDYAKIDGVRFHLLHYPMLSWRGREKPKSIHLYGHSHTRSEDFLNLHFPGRRAMDVGIDNAFKLLGEWRPFSLDEILMILKIDRCPTCNKIDPRHDKTCPNFIVNYKDDSESTH